MSVDPQPQFTLNELLDHLSDKGKTERPGYKTTREWAEFLDLSLKSVRKILNDAWEKNVLLRDEIIRTRYDGRKQKIHVYNFVIPEANNNGD
jgi:hypothetical protein